MHYWVQRKTDLIILKDLFSPCRFSGVFLQFFHALLIIFFSYEVLSIFISFKCCLWFAIKHIMESRIDLQKCTNRLICLKAFCCMLKLLDVLSYIVLVADLFFNLQKSFFSIKSTLSISLFKLPPLYFLWNSFCFIIA